MKRKLPTRWPISLVGLMVIASLIGLITALINAFPKHTPKTTNGALLVDVPSPTAPNKVMLPIIQIGPIETEWPQLQHDPQRTGYTVSRVNPPYRLAWYRSFQPERIGRDVQTIVCERTVFIPTQSGNLYALDAMTGQEKWKAQIGSPILHTPACEDGKVVLAAMDGGVYAISTKDGQPAWRFQANGRTGFSAAPLIAEKTVFIGERAGIFYALNLADGQLKWQFDAGAPIFNSAAYSAGKVYFCDEAIYVHALNARTGSQVWKSEQLYGQSCRQYHPVVYGGYVMIRPMMTHRIGIPSGIPPFDRTWEPQEYADRLAQYADFLAGGPMPQELIEAQERVVQYYLDHPYEQNFFILRESDGQQAFVPPHFHLMTLPGPPPPPVADGRGGIIIPWPFINFGWARLNLRTQQVDQIIVPPRPGNATESVNASVGGNFLYIFHAQEGNAQYTGIFDLNSRIFYDFPRVPNRWGQLTDNNNNGNNSVSIANGYFYHIVFHQVAAWTSQ